LLLLLLLFLLGLLVLLLLLLAVFLAIFVTALGWRRWLSCSLFGSGCRFEIESEVWLALILAEYDCAEDAGAGGHLKDQAGVPRQVLKLAITSFLVKDELEADGNG